MSFMSWLPLAADLGGSFMGMPGLGRLLHALSAGATLNELRNRKQSGQSLHFRDYLSSALDMAPDLYGMGGPMTKGRSLAGKEAGSLGSALMQKPIAAGESRWMRPQLGAYEPLLDALLQRRY